MDTRNALEVLKFMETFGIARSPECNFNKLQSNLTAGALKGICKISHVSIGNDMLKYIKLYK